MAKAARWAGQDVTSQGVKSVWEAACGKERGGGDKSRRIRLWDGFSCERRVAVERPMPDEEPVIRMVLGVVERHVRDWIVGVKRDMVDMMFECVYETKGRVS